MSSSSSKRDFAIDWLRVFAMGIVFLFHCARYFDQQDWHVKNPQSDVVMSFVVLFLSQWIMPLFFISSTRFLGYANEAVLPFYILHQTMIVTIGFYLIHWKTEVFLKYSAICVASSAAICILYESFVRRINVLRFYSV